MLEALKILKDISTNGISDVCYDSLDYQEALLEIEELEYHFKDLLSAIELSDKVDGYIQLSNLEVHINRMKRVMND